MSMAQPNPYAAPTSGVPELAAFAEETARAAFIRRTYTHLFVAILAFAAIEFVVFTVVPDATLARLVQNVSGMMWLAVLGGFMMISWFARSFAESSRSLSTQYLGLGLYVLAEALIFVPLLFIADVFCGGQVIVSAAAITLMMFGGLTFVVFFTGADFSYLRMYLFWGGILALGAIVCGILFGWNLGVGFSIVMIALASGYILYDTSNILHHYRTDQYVAASLALFASVAVLFYYVLRLLIAFSSDD